MAMNGSKERSYGVSTQNPSPNANPRPRVILCAELLPLECSLLLIANGPNLTWLCI